MLIGNAMDCNIVRDVKQKPNYDSPAFTHGLHLLMDCSHVTITWNETTNIRGPDHAHITRDMPLQGSMWLHTGWLLTQFFSINFLPVQFIGLLLQSPVHSFLLKCGLPCNITECQSVSPHRALYQWILITISMSSIVLNNFSFKALQSA